MSISLRNLDRICLVGVVVIAGALGSWVVKRGAAKQMEIQRENNLFAKHLRNLNLADAKLHDLKQVVEEARNEIKALNDCIPDTADIGEFLKQVDALIKRRDIFLQTLQPLPKIAEKHHTRIPIRIVLRGTFINIFNLIHDLETMTRMLVVDKISISTAGSPTQCSADLTASIFERGRKTF